MKKNTINSASKIIYRSILRYVFIVAIMVTCFISASAQQELSGKSAQQAAAAISKDYKNWRAAGWTAKVKTDALPLSVTIKTYMLRDSLTLISVRAPFVGEVARIEIDSRNVYVVNKLKKVYAQINLTDYGRQAAIVHSNLQDIMMGRVTKFDLGTLSKSNYKEFTIMSYGADNYLVTCQLPEEFGSINYGYATDKSGRMIEMMAVKGKPRATQAPDGMQSEVEELSAEASAQVTYNGSTADALIDVSMHGRGMQVALEGMKLEYGINGFDRLDIRSYRNVGLREVLKF